jgi:hypothetical protein
VGVSGTEKRDDGFRVGKTRGLKIRSLPLSSGSMPVELGSYRFYSRSVI